MSVLLENARWVRPAFTRDGCGYHANEWFMFRNWLRVEHSKAVTAIIAVDSKYWLYVNDQLVVREGGLKRGPVADGSYYDTVDLSPYLHEGENSIALLLWYFGKHGFSHRDSGMPGLLFEVKNAALAGSWKARVHPSYFDPGYVHDAYRLSEGSIGFDARRDLPGWFKADYDDSGWPETVDCGVAGSSPWGQLEVREFPQWFWSEAKDYTTLETMDSGCGDGYVFYRCKLPHNAHFVPILEVDAVSGVSVSIHVAQDTSRLQSVYITRSGEQAHEFEGWLSGQEVIYKVPSDAVRVKRLQYRETAYPARFAGDFSCDEPIFNQLWIKSRRTLLVTMRDTFMDCPCRERAQWPGDLVVQLGQVPYCLERSADLLVRKGLRETLRWQRPDGIIYGPVPEGNWKCELPAQMLAVVSPYGIWTYYMNTADRSTLAELYPYAKRYFDIWQIQQNGLLVYRPDAKGLIPVSEGDQSIGIWDWIDWGDGIDAEVCLNAWFVLAAQGLRLMAEALGADQDAAEIARKEAVVTQAMRKHFWDGEQGAYRSPGFCEGPDDRAQALAILSGVALPDQYEPLTGLLCDVRRSCPYMEKYALEALLKMGKVGQALERMRSRYRGLVENDCSTLWERWPEHTTHPGTINHSWSGGPLTLLSGMVAGIYPLEPGWKCFAISPEPGALGNLQAQVSTPCGEIAFAAHREGGEWKVSVLVPAGTQALADFSAFGSTEGPFTIEAGEWIGRFSPGLPVAEGQLAEVKN